MKLDQLNIVGLHAIRAKSGEVRRRRSLKMESVKDMRTFSRIRTPARMKIRNTDQG